jgi:hypothetical protein
MTYGLRTIDGAWLRSFDPDVHGPGKPYPSGDAKFTVNPAKALRFATTGEAFEFWRQQSRVCPLRPDGEPNRPLTAFTIEIARFEEATP